MNRRQQESIEVRVARVGGDLADLLGLVNEHLPAEYVELSQQAKQMTDAMRSVRRAAEAAVDAKYRR